MTMNMKPIYKACMPALAAVFAFGAVTAVAQSTMAMKEDAAQLKSDRAALERQMKRLEADEATLKADTASGKMSAVSKDAYEVYKAKEGVKGAKHAITHDKSASLQMKADKAALNRQMKRLDLAEARLKADTEDGKMSAMSKDSEKVYKDRQSATAEKKQIASEKAK